MALVWKEEYVHHPLVDHGMVGRDSIGPQVNAQPKTLPQAPLLEHLVLEDKIRETVEMRGILDLIIGTPSLPFCCNPKQFDWSP